MKKKNSANLSKLRYKFAGVKGYAFHYKNGVERGKYYKSTIDFLKRENINVNIRKRGVIKDRWIKKWRLIIYRIRIWLKCWKVEFQNRQI